MIKIFRLLAGLLVSTALADCAAPPVQYFADSDHELITSASLDQVPPTEVRLEVKFYRGNQEITGAEPKLRHAVINALNSTSVLRATDDPAATAVLHIEVLDFLNPSERQQGDYLFSGMTYGSVSTSRITDRYEFKLRYEMPDGHERFAQDEHAIWTQTGEARAPSLRGPYETSGHAFQAVVTDVVLSFLKDINQSTSSDDSVIFVPGAEQ
jgi:hypothetical protein